MANILTIMTKFGIEKKPFDILKDLAEKHKVLRKFCKTNFTVDFQGGFV